VRVVLACPWCAVLGPLKSAEKARWFPTEHGKNDDTAFSH
jgi:hypothetical protein